MPELTGYERKLSQLVTQDDAALSAFIADGELGRLRALAIQRTCKDAQPLGWLDNPCERQNLNLPFPTAPKKEMKLFALNNEWQALGVEIANPDPEPRTVKFDLSGFEAFDRVQFRRVVALENWYMKENELTPDALTLLKDNELVLEPGEHTRLYLAFKTKTPGTFQVKINDLAATVTVSPKSLPETEFGNFQFLYPWLPPFTGKAFAMTVRDLAEHYTTDVEFPPLPDVTFNQDGTVAQDKIAGSRAERVFKMFATEKIRSVFYWMGQRKNFKYADGSKVPFNTDELDKSAPPNVLTPQWETVYPALVHAWMNHLRKLGLEQWMASLPFDEAHSGKETAPGSNLYMVKKIYELTRAAEPKLSRYLTCGHWTLPEDIELVLPELDVAVIHWPQPDEYRGKPVHKLYVEKVLPMLRAEREKRGMKIWSYRVEGGKNMNPDEERCYPLAMAGWGVTGIGTWAYYVSNGRSSWDDTDGKILDYCFIYNGLEKHPICEKYNITGELIVPSLRWEALRLGIQDAKILLALPSTPEVEQLKKECAEIAVTKKWDIQRLLEISQRLRELWADQ